jgi:1-aminocyclopropane-1-carboxylate deaminase/D-cysteine desulfhydrase-like pyridoxal-dependent ACC family enzyme
MAETLKTVSEIRDLLKGLARVELASLPTPLNFCPRLSHHLDGPKIFIKRDDMTGLAFGGNKVRQHEYVLGAALAGGADCFVQGASSQSNHSRQLAAAGAKLGIETYLLPKQDLHSSPVQGNYLVDHILGAVIDPIEPSASTIRAKEDLVERLRTLGRKPYVTGMGAEESLALAAVAYVETVLEILEQVPAGTNVDAIYTASQGSTQGGLMLACELLGLPTKVVGISPLGPEHEAHIPTFGIVALIHRAAEILGVKTAITEADVEIRFDFVGKGYGQPSPAGLEAIALLGRTEAILLDPIYTGKAFAGLLADVRAGRFGRDEVVIYLHTGGLPALFAYAEPVYEAVVQAKLTKEKSKKEER